MVEEERIHILEGLTILFALFFRVIIGTLILDYLARFYPSSFFITKTYGMIIISIGCLCYVIMPLYYKFESVNWIGGKKCQKKNN